MIIGIQRPDTTVLDPSLKSGLCTKVGFSQNNNASSLVVADTAELTNIENRKALLMAGNKREWFRSLYITDKIINNYIKDSKTYNNKDFNKFLIPITEQLEELKEKITPNPKKATKNKVKVKVKNNVSKGTR